MKSWIILNIKQKECIYVLVLIGEVDPNKQDFLEWSEKSKQGHYINLGEISNNEKMY